MREIQAVDRQTEEFQRLQEQYENESAWGLAASIDLHGCDPETIRDEEKVRQYVDELCKLIGMRKFGDCTVVNFGEDPEVTGFSMAQLIETSLISGHFANKSNRAFIDIFSCKLYDPFAAAEFSKRFFGADDAVVKCTMRR